MRRAYERRQILAREGALTPPEVAPAASVRGDVEPAVEPEAVAPVQPAEHVWLVPRVPPWQGKRGALSCRDCGGSVVESHAGTAPELACPRCPWRYRKDAALDAWVLQEG